MKQLFIVLALLVGLLIIFSTTAQAQFYFGPSVGFKAMGLKGATSEQFEGRNVTAQPVDAGKTNFAFGLFTGYQILPKSSGDVQYKLDIQVEGNLTWGSFMEDVYKKLYGHELSADNGSGGSTWIWTFNLMPIHRLYFPKFRLLSPFGGAGMGFNILSTKDITYPNANWTGSSEFKIGLLLYYGTVFGVSDVMQPFIEFKHLIPFGGETKFTSTYTEGNTSQTDVVTVKDVPGAFQMMAGVRFTF